MTVTTGAIPVPAPKNLSKIQGRGQITIPADMRKKLGWKKGDSLKSKVLGKKLVIEKE